MRRKHYLDINKSMKRIVLMVIIINCFLLHSQENTIGIEYALVIQPEGDLFNDNSTLKQMLNNAVKNAKHEKFTLLIKNEGSKFFHNEILSDEDIISKSPMFVNYSGKTYTFNDSVYTQSTAIGKNIYVKKKQIDNWVVTTETKMIDNYKCYKATNVFIVESPNKTFHHPVVAWFCPDLPYSFGPNGCSGLPRLILELQERFVVYGVRKIDFNTNQSFNIIEMKGVKTMKQKDVDDLLEKRMNEEFSEFKK